MLAQSVPAQSAASPLFPMVMVFLIFYFLVFRPQKTKQKEAKAMIANLKKNDAVVTAGGIHGSVTNVKDKTVVIRVDDNVRIEFDKESITSVIKQKVEEKKG